MTSTLDSTTPRSSAQSAAPTRRPRLVHGYAALAIGESLVKVLTFATFTYLAHVLGPGNYGVLEFVLAILLFCQLAVDMGLPTYGAREIARDPELTNEFLYEITLTRALLSAGVLVVLATAIGLASLTGLSTRFPTSAVALLAAYAASLLLLPLLMPWAFQGHDKMHLVALLSIVRQGVFAALVFSLVRGSSDLVLLGVAEFASVGAAGVISVLLVHRVLRVPWEPARLRWPTPWRHLRQSAPVGASELAWVFEWYVATMCLFAFAGPEEAGPFGAAHRIIVALHTFVWLYFFNLLPSISRTAPGPASQLKTLLQTSLSASVSISVLAALSLGAVSVSGMTILYGSAFESGSLSLTILAWMLPLSMLSGHFRYTLIGYGLQHIELGCTFLGGLSATIASLLLVPNYGAQGAAIALVLAKVVNLVAAYACVAYHVAVVPPIRPLLVTLLASAFWLLVWRQFSHLGVWPAAWLAAAGYVAVVMALEGRHLSAAFFRHPSKEGA